MREALLEIFLVVALVLGFAFFAISFSCAVVFAFAALPPDVRKVYDVYDLPSVVKTAEPRNDVLSLAFNRSALKVGTITSVPDLKPIVN